MSEKQLRRSEILDMRSVLERALQRRERQNRIPDDDPEIEQLARAVRDLSDELARL